MTDCRAVEPSTTAPKPTLAGAAAADVITVLPFPLATTDITGEELAFEVNVKTPVDAPVA